MTKKRLLTYGLVGAFLVAIALMVYLYQEYLGEDPIPNVKNGVSPIINKRLNAVVLRTTTLNADSQPKLDVAYTDLDTQETASFTINDQYRQSIHVGDTLTKEKGEKLLLIYQEGGKIETVPID